MSRATLCLTPRTTTTQYRLTDEEERLVRQVVSYKVCVLSYACMIPYCNAWPDFHNQTYQEGDTKSMECRRRLWGSIPSHMHSPASYSLTSFICTDQPHIHSPASHPLTSLICTDQPHIHSPASYPLTSLTSTDQPHITHQPHITDQPHIH